MPFAAFKGAICPGAIRRSNQAIRSCAHNPRACRAISFVRRGRLRCLDAIVQHDRSSAAEVPIGIVSERLTISLLSNELRYQLIESSGDRLYQRP